AYQGILMNTLIIAVVSALFIPLGPIWFIRRDLIRPLERLIDFSHEIAGGNLKATIQGSFVCELADLKESLVQMVSTIKKNMDYSEGVLHCLSGSFPYLTLDTSGRITKISQVLIDLLDISGSPESIEGKTPGKAFFNDESRSTTSTEVLKTHKKIERQADITTQKGNRRVFVSTALPILDSDKKILGSFTLYFDLTTVRLQEEEIREKNRCITEVAEKTIAIARDVNDSSENLSHKIAKAEEETGVQKDRVTESATAMEEMNATVLEVARNSQQAATHADEASSRVREGSKALKQLISEIQEVAGVINGLDRRVGELSSQADNIGQVISVINDIADQTNLLALNAAIEAARAGDAGRGFAVVADEVRKLAEKTMAATTEVGEVIRSIQESSKEADQEMGKAAKNVQEVTSRATTSGDLLQEILSLVEETSFQVQSIASAVEQQSAASEQISRAMTEVDSIASGTQSTMQFARQAIFHLKDQAEELSRLINTIQHLDEACAADAVN
ncbi:MAG: methyl-accepting chemotaxis protein, partial [Desulfovibrionales bacterium]